jgi:hypothetical protein
VYFNTVTTVLYYWNGYAWMPLTGQLLAVQTQRGTVNGYTAYGGANWIRHDGNNYLVISYTPPVDCWWDVNYNIGLVQALSGAYYYPKTNLSFFSGGPDADGITSVAGQLQMQHANVQTFMSYSGSHVFKLNAGVAYQMGVYWDGGVASWQVHNGPEYMHIQGKAFAR